MVLWFKGLGFRKDPFDILDTDYTPEGVNDKYESLSENIVRKRLTIIYGKPGTGKTTLAKYFQKKNIFLYNTIYINCKRYSGIKGIKANELLKNKKIFIDYRKVVVILDEIHRLSETVLDQFISLKEDKKIYDLVGIKIKKELKNASDSFLDRLEKGSYILMDKISLDANQDMIKKRLKNKKLFKDEALKRIIEKSGYIPRTVLKHCTNIIEEIKTPTLKDPITLNDVSSYDFKSVDKVIKKKDKIKEIKSEEKKIVKEEIDEIKELEKIPEFKNNSPTQKKVLIALRTSEKETMKISEEIGIPSNQVRKALSDLKKKNLVVNTNTRPVIWDLEAEFKRKTILR